MYGIIIKFHLSPLSESDTCGAPLLRRRLRRQDAVGVGDSVGSRGERTRASPARAVVQMLRGVCGAQGMK